MKFIPNAITMLRIILVPVFLWFAFITPEKPGMLLALVVFAVASISDYFDGMLARRLNVVSNFGKIMDPLADKLLVIAALAALLRANIQMIDLWVLIIVVGREIAVTMMRNYYSRHNVIIPANIWGKLKTVTQMVGISLALLLITLHIYNRLPENIWAVCLTVTFWYFRGVALITFMSGATYFIGKKEKH
ncbi:MAG: CDP-diacylglycerol--glycerol-3-phosphate 3-phosphatidyltransferase [Candidatus Cloacimonetes bacterium]|nr:CDP-diacylglycerol--glycerol-3-phosphate 3-phosphatidyltransferase [Candidatus Cloacimonadota bacterium]